MLNVALTGNIAAGKSAVAELFRRWGATVLDADAIVREVQTPGGPVMRRIVERFGEAVVGPDGSLDRPALRRIVMADAAARQALERIVHPAVYARRAELAASEGRSREMRRNGAVVFASCTSSISSGSTSSTRCTHELEWSRSGMSPPASIAVPR